MKVVNLRVLQGKEVTHMPKCRNYGYTIEHDKPIGWMGTTSKYFGWFRYKKDAILRMNEINKLLPT